jgi:predicted amidohydrolase YtcJ
MQDMQALQGPATVLEDLGGAAVTPGMVDAHLHLVSLGNNLTSLDLAGTTSFEEVLGRTAQWLEDRPDSGWLLGRGWDQNDWKVKRMPDNRALNRIAPETPVLLRRVDGHAALANEAALTAAGIGPDTPDPDGGKIFRDPKSGRPSGLLLDNAIEIVMVAIPKPTPEDLRRTILAAAAHCASLGLTAVHDAGVDADQLEVYCRLAAEGALPIRVYAMLEGAEPGLLDQRLPQGPDTDFSDRLAVRCVKLYADGALGSRGAALLDPYADDPDNRGLLLTQPEDLRRLYRQAADHGFQVATHAIGDRANRMVLDIIEEVLSPEERERLRPRIEHAQILHPEDLPRFSTLGVIPSMQPTHCTSDMPWAPDRLGDVRLTGAYAWRSLLESGCRIPGGSDAPVESADPRLGLYAAVTRRGLDGLPEGGWNPGERLSPAEALAMFTRDAGWASFSEGLTGTIEPGKRADLTVLSLNPLLCAAEEIPGIEVLATLVDGEYVFSKEDRP